MSLFNFFYRRLRAYHTYQAVQTLGSTARFTFFKLAFYVGICCHLFHLIS